MPYTTVVTFTAGQALPAADLNSNFANLDYLNSKINSEIQIDAAAWIPRSDLPASPGQYETSTNKNVFNTMDYPDTGSYIVAVANIVMPADYDGGTVTAIIHWIANSTSTNSVVWGLTARCFTDNETLDSAMGSAAEVTDANKSTAHLLNITGATSACTIAGTPAAGELCQFHLYRNSGNGSDTLAATARMLKVVITYTRS
jgi:hypothetical protein